MPLKCQADGNVPFLPGRSRYDIVNLTATWCYHRMAAGSTLSGEAPRTATTTEADTDPTVTGGRAEYKTLTKGGLFTLQAQMLAPLIVLALDNTANATLTLVMSGDPTLSRAVPTSLPFKIAAGEALKATGGSSGSYVGILYEIDSLQRW